MGHVVTQILKSAMQRIRQISEELAPYRRSHRQTPLAAALCGAAIVERLARHDLIV
jgi:hypothetical protein